MNQWVGQRPGLQDISGGANFANKADNGIVVHRNWAKLKELQERAGAVNGKSASGKSKKQSMAEEPAGNTAMEGAEEKPLDITDFEVQVYVDKVRQVELHIGQVSA